MWDSKWSDWAYFWEWIGLMCKHAWGWLPHVPFTWCFHAHTNAYNIHTEIRRTLFWLGSGLCIHLFSLLSFMKSESLVSSSLYLPPFIFFFTSILLHLAPELFVASARSFSLQALHFWIVLLLIFSSLAVLSRFLFFSTSLNTSSFCWTVYEALGMFIFKDRERQKTFLLKKKKHTHTCN